MPLVKACIAPHGFPIIPALSEDAEGALATRAAMEALAGEIAEAQPEVFVLASPHGLRVHERICLSYGARAAGTLHWQERQLEMNFSLDRELTEAIAERATARGVPVALGSFAGNRFDQSVIPLDWGSMTPLWFFGHRQDRTGLGHVLADVVGDDDGAPAVLMTPSRALPPAQMVEHGRAMAEAIEADSRRVVFVASCDWAHTHREDGPYGAHPEAATADGAIVEAIERDDLASIAGFDVDLFERTATDGFWQTLMLVGIAELVPLTGRLLCYEAPSYYGMITASFDRHHG